jgi:hypothetical protein
MGQLINGINFQACHAYQDDRCRLCAQKLQQLEDTKSKSSMGEHLVSAVGGALTAALSHVTSFPLGSFSRPSLCTKTI